MGPANSIQENTFYTFTWKIENISFYTGKMDTDLNSPSFKIGGTEFQIYLNSGDWSTKGIFLRVLGSQSQLPYMCLKSELTLLRVDSEVIESHVTEVGVKFNNVCHLFPKPALFSNEKVLLTFLPQNTLTIRWKIYSIGSGGCFFRTVFSPKIIRWEIDDFGKNLTFNKSFQLSSLYFNIELQRNPSMNIVMVKMIPPNEDRLHFGNCTIAAVEEETIYHYGEVNILYCKDIPSPSWEAPVMLSEGVCNLIKNDTLTLHFAFTVGIGEIWNGREPQTKRNLTIPQSKDTTDCSTTLGSSSTLPSNLLRLYEDGKFCDATLRTVNASFPVHKIILCAMSPMFCDMFESDTEASRTGVVHISDVGSDTLAQMLLFLYTDSLGEIPWEMASGLYDAANKYCIQTLKEKCLSVLKETLSVTNACDTLVLADTHHDEDLLQSVKDFIFDHDEVICSMDWKELEEKNPQLTIQLLHEMHFKRNK